MILWLVDLIAWMSQMPQWVPDVTLGAGGVAVVAEVAFLLHKAVNRQVSIDEGRTWHRSTENAYRQAGTRVLDPAVAQMPAVNARTRYGQPSAYTSPSVKRTIHIRREGDVEEIEAREVVRTIHIGRDGDAEEIEVREVVYR